MKIGPPALLTKTSMWPSSSMVRETATPTIGVSDVACDHEHTTTVALDRVGNTARAPTRTGRRAPHRRQQQLKQRTVASPIPASAV